MKKQKNKKVIKILNEEKLIPWVIRIVDEGDKHGLNDCLTHKKDKHGPSIEFYDARYPHTRLIKGFSGQFVSSYYVSTLLEDEEDLTNGGLNLAGQEQDWSMDGNGMKTVFAFIKLHV